MKTDNMKNHTPRNILRPLGLLLASTVFLTFASVGSISQGETAAKVQNGSKTPASIVIADFNRGSLINNLNGESGTWEKNPDDKAQWALASSDDLVRRGESGSSLKLEYSVNSAENAVNGFWTQLRDFDASKYDHFEFWVKGDERKGFTTVFRIEFNKYQKDNEGQEETYRE